MPEGNCARCDGPLEGDTLPYLKVKWRDDPEIAPEFKLEFCSELCKSDLCKGLEAMQGDVQL